MVGVSGHRDGRGSFLGSEHRWVDGVSVCFRRVLFFFFSRHEVYTASENYLEGNRTCSLLGLPTGLTHLAQLCPAT